MECSKCKSIMKCSGVSNKYQDWYCPICNYQEQVEKSTLEIFHKKNSFDKVIKISSIIYKALDIYEEDKSWGFDCMSVAERILKNINTKPTVSEIDEFYGRKNQSTKPL